MLPAQHGKKSCFSDQPINSKEHDHLKNNQYAEGLLNFIRIADAPITIGIQGGWGSGKTSLINLLQHELEARNDTLCVTVNAWQQSLFASGSGGQIALSLLDGAYAEIYQKARNSNLLGANLKEILEKTSKSFFGAIKLATTLYTGVPLPSGNENPMRPSQTFKLLKTKLNETIAAITNSPENNITRIVIFVDDLDRIQPEVAVEILDVLKNIFDIEGCISVLAIDYDVVIKGLRKKFGEQSNNQREFRQYFDKIIQIPFSMPTGSYRNKIPALLKHLTETVLPEAIDPQAQEEIIEDIAQTVLRATDGVPRSIKRIINTVSLLSIIEASAPSETDKVSPTQMAPKALHFKILFTAVCLQVSFPDIHKALCQQPDFKNWTEETTSTIWHIPEPAEDSPLETDFFDEWENALLRLIRYHGLDTKALDIRDIMLELSELVGQPWGMQILLKNLRTTSITDVDANRVEDLGNALSKSEADQHCKQILNALLSNVEGVLGIIHRTKVAKEQEDGTWSLEHTGRTRGPIRIEHLEQVDIITGSLNNIPWYAVEFYIPSAGKSLALRNKILTNQYFNDPYGNNTWFRIKLPDNPSGSPEPNIDGFVSETLPRIQKLLDILD